MAAWLGPNTYIHIFHMFMYDFVESGVNDPGSQSYTRRFEQKNNNVQFWSERALRNVNCLDLYMLWLFHLSGIKDKTESIEDLHPK